MCTAGVRELVLAALLGIALEVISGSLSFIFNNLESFTVNDEGILKVLSSESNVIQ